MSDRIAVMDDGRVLQIGTPRDVYEEPESRFVAGFVGVSNQLELTVERSDGDVVTLRLGPDDAVSADHGGGAADGATAIVTIRPERIALEDRGERTECYARGRVRESLYAGPTSRFVVELDGGGELMVVKQNATTSYEDVEALRGRPVVLTWKREYTRVIAINEKGDA
jgi:ABC-type Fe3+/spermidine/putrescine transport system ATPase subunit